MYKVFIDGVEIQCDSADEAFEFVTRLRNISANGNGASIRSDKSLQVNGAVGMNGSRWTATRFQNFAGLLNENEQRALNALISNPDGMPDATLRQALGLSSNKSFGPIFTGISRKAKKVGVTFEDVISSEVVRMTNGDNVREFRAVPAFMRIAAETGALR